jgi:hypothetical protein
MSMQTLQINNRDLRMLTNATSLTHNYFTRIEGE